MPRYLAALVIIALVVGLDSITKFLIVQNLVLYRSNIPIIPNFLDIVYYKNTGAAFGILAGFSFSHYFFLAISFIALVMLFVAFKYASKEGKLVQIALPLLIGGTLGNLIDRIRLGAVIDFILVHWYDKFYWPAFNVADSAITVGVVLLILEMLRKK
jgi:signal peptidase II